MYIILLCFYSASQIHIDDQTKPQLVVLLNNNYGLPNNNHEKIVNEDKSSKNNTLMDVSNHNMTSLKKTPVNGTNISQIVNSNLHEKVYSR